MKNNPVFEREMAVRARSIRMPLVIMVCNGLLAAVALLNMYSVVAQVKISASIQYSSFLQLYAFVVTLEFLMLMFLMPALTSGSISGERERGTLELLFTTQMTPADIILGKLFSAFHQLLVLVVSSFPALLLTFVYGSVDFKDLGLLMVCFVTVALLTGGIGILSSTFMRRSTFSNVCTYGVLLLVVVGTYMLNAFLLNVSQMNIDSLTLDFWEARPVADSGMAVYLLLLNPGMTFSEILGGQLFDGTILMGVSQFLGGRPANFITDHWILVSLAVQLLLAV